jgi:hypothetical protein
MDGALYLSSGPGEQKSRNLAANRHCAATTGCNTWDEGFDIVLHGEAVVVRDLPLLQQVAGALRLPAMAPSAVMGYRWSTS